MNLYCYFPNIHKIYEVCNRWYPAMYYEKYRHLLKKTQDTRNIVHKTMMPQSPSKEAPWDLTQFSQLPSASLMCFPESHQQYKISSLSKVILVLGKARSCRASNLACRETELPECLMFCLKASMRRDT